MHAVPVKFHLKSLFPGNLLMPIIFLILNLGVTVALLQIVLNVGQDKTLNVMGGILVPLCLLTVVFYLLSAFTNPGLLIGDEEAQLKKAQDWNFKHQEQLNQQNQEISIQNDKQVFKQSHQRQQSILTKENQSRHERNKINQFNLAGMFVGGSNNIHYEQQNQYEMANLESQPSSALNTMPHSLDNTMMKHLKASTISHGDNQMSMQLYGQEKGPQIMSSNGIYST